MLGVWFWLGGFWRSLIFATVLLVSGGLLLPVPGATPIAVIRIPLALEAGQVGRERQTEIAHAPYRWGSLSNWLGPLSNIGESPIELAPWPVRRLPRWIDRVNQALSKKELQALRHSVTRNLPFGDATWTTTTAQRLDRHRHQTSSQGVAR